MQASIAGWQAGWATARRVYEDPATAYAQQSFMNQASAYSLLWSYYNNSMFEKTVNALNVWSAIRPNAYNPWAMYKANYNLYRNIRMIHNPVRRLVDFYAGSVYPGALSEDGEKLPDGVSLAIPFSDDTPDELKAAIAQLWTWDNWQAKKSLIPRYGAALGSCFVEVIDDVARGKVTTEVVWPGFIVDLDLDAAGNVKSYILEYQSHDDESAYIYRKEVDDVSIRYYRDSKPYDFTGNGPEIENIYGFVPAVWMKHIDIGGTHGSAAVAGSLGKIDELNSIISHAHDQIHKVIGSPSVIFSSGNISNLFNNAKRGPSNEIDTPQSAEQESVLMWKGPADGHVASLVGNLSLADTALYIDRLISEIEKDHPELTFYQELRGMSQVTGPAASRLVSDVSNRLAEAQAAYDQGVIKLFQMICAIGGERANSGAWGTLNRQQQKFTPFDLTSYEAGQLDIAIMPRQLLTPTKEELAREKESMWRGVKMGGDAGVPLEILLKSEGWTDDQLLELQQAKEQAAQRAIERMQATAGIAGPATSGVQVQAGSQDQQPGQPQQGQPAQAGGQS